MKSIRDIQDLKDKRVLLRVDFDVPVSNGQIQEDFKIKKQKETIDYLAKAGAKIIMVAHSSDASSLSAILPQLHILLGREIGFVKTLDDMEEYLNSYPEVGLLENIRSFQGETENSKDFASRLAMPFDIYVNNAFAVCHRVHASIVAVTEHLPSYAGFLVEEETRSLSKALEAPPEGKIVIMGGAKTATKIPSIKNFLTKAETILLGGVIANDAVALRGYNIRKSVVDPNYKELFEGIDMSSEKIVVPHDFAVGDDMILDIGKETINLYIDFISKAKMIIWNGPLGQFENETFAIGTNAIAKAISESRAYKIAGGEDTVTAIDRIGLLKKFDFVSTGGGAMLDFLAGKELPGLNALGYGK